jgi:hypothetical protein
MVLVLFKKTWRRPVLGRTTQARACLHQLVPTMPSRELWCRRSRYHQEKDHDMMKRGHFFDTGHTQRSTQAEQQKQHFELKSERFTAKNWFFE